MKTTLIKHTQRMTSLEIAELTGKQHKHVMEAIRRMEPAWKKVNGSNFRLVDYKDAKGEARPCYSLTKTECLYIATKFNDEARARLVLRWEELEGRSTPYPSVQRLLVTDSDIMNEAERIVGRELNRNNQNADGCITTTDIARTLGMETKDLNSFLTDIKVQRWARGQFRLTAEYEGRGLAQDRLFIYYSKEGRQKSRTYLVWTQKGRELLETLIKR